MKSIINHNNFISNAFRKSFLQTIYNEIEKDEKLYCCCVITWHKLFICWKNLKEVKNNMDSGYLRDVIISGREEANCINGWFSCKSNRLGFLKECIKSIK